MELNLRLGVDPTTLIWTPSVVDPPVCIVTCKHKNLDDLQKFMEVSFVPKMEHRILFNNARWDYF